MCIEDVGVAAVIFDGYILAVFLEDVACMSCIAAAAETCQGTAVPNRIFVSHGCRSYMRLLFVSPGCTVLQIEIEFADIMHIIAILMLVGLIFFMGSNACPGGFIVGQRNIKNARVFKFNNLFAAKGRRLHAMQTVDIHITADGGSSVTGNAVLHVDVQRTSFNAYCIVVMRFVRICSCCYITAANRNLVANLSQSDTAAIDTGNIYRAVNSNCRTYACYRNACAINTACAVCFCFDIADFQRTVDNNIGILTAYNNTAYSRALGSNIGNLYWAGNVQLSSTSFNENTVSTVGIIIGSSNCELLVGSRISNCNIRTVSHKNTCSLRTLFYYRAKSQALACHFYIHRHRSFFRIKSSGKLAVALGNSRLGYLNFSNAVGIKLTCFADILGLADSAGIVLRLFTGWFIVIIALTGFLGAGCFGREGNIAGFQCCGGSSQPVGNLHYTGQIAVCIVFVEQLACHAVQYICYIVLGFGRIAIFKAGGNACIVCYKGNSRAFSCIGNIKIAADNIGRVSSIMLIENSSMTSVIYNRNRIIVLLVNQAGICRIAAAMQTCQGAAAPLCFRNSGSSYMGLLLVGPGCTILQIQVNLADIMHSIAAAAIIGIILVIGCNTLPEGFVISQSNIENACVCPINKLAASIFHNLLAILTGCIHITGNLSGRISCSTVLHIDVKRALFYTYCIEIMRFIAVLCCSNITAANRYLGILACQLDTAAAYTGDIYRTCNSNRGCITGYQNTGSINTLAAFSYTLDIADFQRAVNFNLALFTLNTDAVASITFSSNIGDFYRTGNIQMSIAFSINAMSTGGTCIIRSNGELLLCRRINNINICIIVCINSSSLTCAGCCTQSQSLAAHIDNHRVGGIGCFACIKSAGQLCITAVCCRLGYINMRYAIDIQLTGFADILRLSNSACFVISLIFFRSIVIEALASLGKGNVASLHGSRRSSQAFGNRYTALKVAVACHIPQLVCQRIQYFADIIFLCSGISSVKALGNTVVAGIKHHLGAFLGIKNLYITADNSSRRCVSMVIPHLGNTLSVCYMDRIVIIYLDNAGRCLILTADKAAQMRNTVIFFIIRSAVICKISGIKAVLTGCIFINPLCAVLHPQIYFAGFCSTGIIDDTLPGGILCGQADVKATVLINHSLSGLIRSLHCQHVADHFYLAVLCFQVLYIDVNRTAVACQSIIRLDEFAEAFNKILFPVWRNNFGRIANQ